MSRLLARHAWDASGLPLLERILGVPPFAVLNVLQFESGYIHQLIIPQKSSHVSSLSTETVKF
jgi:hypothetical protein